MFSKKELLTAENAENAEIKNLLFEFFVIFAVK